MTHPHFYTHCCIPTAMLSIYKFEALFFSPNTTYQGLMDINYISAALNPITNVLLVSWMNMPDENSIVSQNNVYGIFAKYDENKAEMTILNKHSAEINLNSDFWSAYHPRHIQLSEENNCSYFMPYKELEEIPNAGVGYLSIFDDNFDHVYHHSSRANDDIYVGNPSLNVN